MKNRQNMILVALLAVAGAGTTTGCSPYAPASPGPKTSTVWGMLPMDAVVSGNQQQELALQTPYWPFMQLRAEKDLFALKFSWMRPDEQPSSSSTGGWLEFLAPQGGSFDEDPESVHAVVESASGKIPVHVVRLPVEGGRYILSGVPAEAGAGAKLLVTAEFGERQDTVAIPLGSDSRE